MTPQQAEELGDFVSSVWPTSKPEQVAIFSRNIERGDYGKVMAAIVQAHEAKADFCPYDRIYAVLPAKPVALYRDPYPSHIAAHEAKVAAATEAWSKLNRAERESTIRRATANLPEHIAKWELELIDRETPSRTLWPVLMEV